MNPLVKYFKIAVFKNYANFSGRARRKEYWYFTLSSIIIQWIFLIPAIMGMASEGEIKNIFVSSAFILYFLGLLVSLILLLPSLAVSVRRLHDTGRSGWFFLLIFVPLGAFVLLYFLVQDSQPMTNEWGPNPKDHHEIELIGNNFHNTTINSNIDLNKRNNY